MENAVLITGASGGIGYELAKLFSENGHNVVLVARSGDKLERIKEELEQGFGISAYALAKDLTAENAAKELLEAVTQLDLNIDILVNNAGFGDYAEFLDSDFDKQKRMVGLNITALMQMTHVFGNVMRKNGSGRILNVASAAALSPGPYMATYYASKAFVLSFSEAIAEELREYGVTVTAICLGPASTGFETAAGMDNSHLFKMIKPVSAASVAKTAYKALMKGRVTRYHGLPTKAIAFAARLSPRILLRKCTKAVNKKPEK